jgi:WD40 repeat protein
MSLGSIVKLILNMPVRRWLATFSAFVIVLHCAGTPAAAQQPQAAAAQQYSSPVVTRVMVGGEKGLGLVAQTGHSGSVRAIAFSPDGQQVLTGSEDRMAMLWDANTGKELRSFQGHRDGIESVSFSSDGLHVLTASSDGTARIWKAATGHEERAFNLGKEFVTSATFSPDGTQIVTQSQARDGQWVASNHTRVWDVATGIALRDIAGGTLSSVFSPLDGLVLTGGTAGNVHLWDVTLTRPVRSFDWRQAWWVRFSPNGRQVLATTPSTAGLFDVASGKPVHSLVFGQAVHCALFSPNGNCVFIGGDESAALWDVRTGKQLRQLETADIKLGERTVHAAAFSPDGARLATASGHDAIARLWDVNGGNEVLRFEGLTSGVQSVGWSPNGEQIFIGNSDNTGQSWNCTTGQQVRRFGASSSNHRYALGERGVAFSADGREVVTVAQDGSAQLWETASGKVLHRFGTKPDEVRAAAFSPTGNEIVTVSKNTKLVVTDGEVWEVAYWDRQTSKELRRFQASVTFLRHSNNRQLSMPSRNDDYVWGVVMQSAAISPNGRLVAKANGSKILLLEAASGKELQAFEGHEDVVEAVAFSPDGAYVLSGSRDRTARMWPLNTRESEGRRVFEGHSGPVRSVALSYDGRRLLTGSDDGTAALWDAKTSKELFSLISFRDGTWAVVDSEGRFDASNGGVVEGLHWVVGNEPIALNQLKERYYDPGLLAKYMGFKKEPLRDVAAFKEVKPFPELKLAAPTAEKQTLGISLTNRGGGGIGRVVVKVNGKELTADARGPNPNPEAATAELQVDLASDPRIVPGQPNTVEVIAFNSEGYLSSRGLTAVWEPPGAVKESPIELYAIVGGVSEYSDPSLKLHFAAKDAADMAKAIETGARRLFGAEKVHLTLLSASNDPRAKPPTKTNFKSAFEEVRKKAKPGDVVVVYLAGHGTSLARGVDTYCYATQEARSLDSAVLSDPAIRAATTITSEELADWTKEIPAQHQVLILDTCAAGAAAGKLSEKRDISGDQIRALDRLKDRTGFHVLLGCAADRVSYEASKYEQGLLTYSLLQGMRGAALDGDLVDVSTLFKYAVNEVPQLALGVGGIQTPMVIAPRGATPFPIGMLLADDRRSIQVATPKVQVLRPRLSEQEIGDDTLDLIRLLKARLNEENYADRSGPGKSLGIVFVDSDELPGAIRPAGTYAVMENSVKVKMNLRRDGQTVNSFEVAGEKGELQKLVERLVDRIATGVKAVQP